MTERQNTIERIKDDWMVNHAIVVELAKIFQLGDSTLVELEIILFQAKNNRLQNIVNYGDDEFLMIPI